MFALMISLGALSIVFSILFIDVVNNEIVFALGIILGILLILTGMAMGGDCGTTEVEKIIFMPGGLND